MDGISGDVWSGWSGARRRRGGIFDKLLLTGLQPGLIIAMSAWDGGSRKVLGRVSRAGCVVRQCGLGEKVSRRGVLRPQSGI